MPITIFGVGAARCNNENFSPSDACHFCTHVWDQVKVEVLEDVDAGDEIEAPRSKGKGRGVGTNWSHLRHGWVRKVEIGSDELPGPPRTHPLYSGADLEDARIPIKVPRAP
jgi:hypothetical protein